MELSAQLRRAELALAQVAAKELNLAIIRQKNNNERLALESRHCNHLKSFGPHMNLLIDPPSSEAASGDELADSAYHTVANHLVDTCLLRVWQRDEKQWLKNCTAPTIILSNLEQWATLRIVKLGIAKVVGGGKKVLMTDLEVDGLSCRCALIVFRTASEGKAQIAATDSGKLLQKLQSGDLPGLLHGIRGLRRKMCLFLSDYEALDRSKPWSAVVIRNLPPDCTQETLRQLTADFRIPIKRIEKPRKVHEISCSLLVVEDVESAERLCLKMNRREFCGKRIKAHVHPDCCLLRPADSHHRIFNTEISNGVGKKTPKKPVEILDAFSQPVSQTTAVSTSEGLYTAQQDSEPRRSGLPLREFAGESYSSFGRFQHSGVSLLCKYPAAV